MDWQPDLQEARLIRRYKRFLADVELAGGECLTVHCPNTGAMTGCAEPGSRVWLSTSTNAGRKYRHTWELVENAAGELACVHSALANRLVREALEAGRLAELRGYADIRAEARHADGGRMDFLLQSGDEACCVEVKSVTLALGGGLGVFPDAVSERASRHLESLLAARRAGQRAVLLFAVLHTGIDRVAPADRIDPRYGETLRRALAEGVEALAYRAEISPRSIELREPLRVLSRQQGRA